MYEVSLDGKRSFFTDQDPSLTPQTGKGHFNTVQRAEFHDSYTPRDGVKQQREADAREAFANGSTRSMRIRYDAVVSSVEIS